MNSRIAIIIVAVALLALSIWPKKMPNPLSHQEKGSNVEERGGAQQPLFAKPSVSARAPSSADPLFGWRLSRDPFSGQVRTYSGGKIQLDGNDETEKAAAFVNQYSQKLFGVSSGDLVLERTSKAARFKVVYQQMLGGYPVLESGLALIFENGNLSRVQNDLKENPVLPAPPELNFRSTFADFSSKPSGGMRGSAFNSRPELVQEPEFMPRVVLFPSPSGLTFAYQFYVDENPGGRSQIVFDPVSRRVLKKVDMRVQ